MARASASIISTSFSTPSTPYSRIWAAPTFPYTKALGAISLTILKDSSWAGSSIAALWLPTPIPTSSSSAAAARAAFTGIVSGCPPVIEAIRKGAFRRFPRKSTDMSSLSILSSGSALWIRVTSSKPALTFRDSTGLSAHNFRCSIFRFEVVLIILIPYYLD